MNHSRESYKNTNRLFYPNGKYIPYGRSKEELLQQVIKEHVNKEPMTDERDCVFGQVVEGEVIEISLPPQCLKDVKGEEVVLSLNKVMSEEVLMHLSLLRGGKTGVSRLT